MHFTKSILALSAVQSAAMANPSFRAMQMDGESPDNVQSSILDFFRDILTQYEDKPEKNIYKFKFDAENAGGVTGEIWMQYEKESTNPLKAEYKVALDLNGIDLAAIQETYPECDYSDIKVTWQLQTKWDNENNSGFLDTCDADKTGGSFDPTYACGPLSQYNGGVACNAQAEGGKTYDCNPTTYAESNIACEMGDFSGKYGLVSIGGDAGLKVEADGVMDTFAPPESSYDADGWNIGLNLICPSRNNPAILCAKGELDGSDAEQEGDMQMESIEVSNQESNDAEEDCA